MKKYTIKESNNRITIYADNINDAIEMYQNSCYKDASIHHDWLMEHSKKLLEYAKIDNFKAVAYEAKNIIDGLNNNKLI